MNRLRVANLGVCFVRNHASYDSSMLRYEDLANSTKSRAPENNSKAYLLLLEETERNISSWNLNKWEFRLPPLLAPHEKEKRMLQLNILKSFFIQRSKTIAEVENDLNFVSGATGVDPEAVKMKSRLWLQDQVTKLRWSGEVNKAKQLSDAFVRLEVYGARDFRLLERLCAIYGLGTFSTFENAFSNYIVQDEAGKNKIQASNPFSDLLSVIVHRYPFIELLYDFLGFNTAGYRDSLKSFLGQVVEKKHQISQFKRGRALACATNPRLVLFDCVESKAYVSSNDSVYGLPDFVFIHDNRFYFITIASDNFWLRSRQLLHKRQMEGIGRRGSLVFGIPFEKVQMRHILLPPRYLDKASLTRLLEGVFNLSSAEMVSMFPWIDLYDKELDDSDVDFCETQKQCFEADWVTL